MTDRQEIAGGEAVGGVNKGEQIRAHIAWLGVCCEHCLRMACKYDALAPQTAAGLRAVAAGHAENAQTWAEELYAGGVV